jgi:hypothetical protein
VAASGAHTLSDTWFHFFSVSLRQRNPFTLQNLQQNLEEEVKVHPKNRKSPQKKASPSHALPRRKKATSIF